MSLTPKQKRLLDYITSYRARHGYAPSQKEMARHFGFRSLGTVQNYLKRLEQGGYLAKTWNGKRALTVVPAQQQQQMGPLRSGRHDISLSTTPAEPSFRSGGTTTIVPPETRVASLASTSGDDRNRRTRRRFFRTEESLDSAPGDDRRPRSFSVPNSVPNPATPLSYGPASSGSQSFSAPVLKELLVPLLGRVAAGLPLEAIENRDELDLAALIFPAGLPQDTDAYFALKVQGDSMINEGIREGDCIIVRRKPEARAGEIVVASVDNEATLKRYYPFPDRIELHAANPLYGPIVLQRKDMGARQFRIEGVLTTVLRSLA